MFFLFFIEGCGEDNRWTHITIWHQMRVDERQVLEQQLQRFIELHSDFKVEQLYKEPEKLRSGYIIAAIAGLGPDLVYGPSDQIGPFQVMDIILPVEQPLDSTYLGQFNPKAVTSYVGHLYQIADMLGNHLTLLGYHHDSCRCPVSVPQAMVGLRADARQCEGVQGTSALRTSKRGGGVVMLLTDIL